MCLGVIDDERVSACPTPVVYADAMPRTVNPFNELAGSTTAIPPHDLHTFHQNARVGDVPAIAGSLRTLGQYRPIVVNIGTHTGRPNEVLAGNHTLKAIRYLAETYPDDERWSSVLVHWGDWDEDECTKIVLADNRTAELGGYDDTVLLGLLGSVDLEGTGYTPLDLESMQHDMDTDLTALKDAMEGAKTQKPEKRTLPLDLIFSSNSCNWSGALMAYSIGWAPGVISSHIASFRSYRQRYPRGRDLMFIDNEWHGYDHAEHVAAVAEFHPKYATTRDVMTKAQCDESGVEFLTFAQIMEQAEEIAQHCDNVIVIPKHDVIDKIPETIGGKRVVLGYSVPSSYGQTEILPERFKGRPVHLLGGPWSKQRALLTVLGEDCVSIDNNQILKISQYGQVCMRDGSLRPIREFPGADGITSRTMYAALALSLTYIVHDVIDTFGADLTQGQEAEDAIGAEFVEH